MEVKGQAQNKNSAAPELEGTDRCLLTWTIQPNQQHPASHVLNFNQTARLKRPTAMAASCGSNAHYTPTNKIVEWMKNDEITLLRRKNCDVWLEGAVCCNLRQKVDKIILTEAHLVNVLEL